MFAIAFDLSVKEAEKNHPKGVSAACSDVAKVPNQYGFARIQYSVYVNDNEDLANLTMTMNALKSMSWFPATVSDIRAFRVEQWSDFTAYMKGTATPPAKKPAAKKKL